MFMLITRIARGSVVSLSSGLLDLASHQVAKVRDSDAIDVLKGVGLNHPANGGAGVLQVILHTRRSIEMAQNGDLLRARRGGEHGLGTGGDYARPAIGCNRRVVSVQAGGRSCRCNGSGGV